MIHIENETDKAIILKCLQTSLNQEFFPDWEYHALIGLDRDEVAKMIENWNTIDIKDSDVQLAIGNTLVNLLGYPHGKHDELDKYTGLSEEELQKFYIKVNK